MDPREALDKTLNLFKIKAVDLADLSGVDPQMISRYRNKRSDFYSLNMIKLADALPDEARFYFYSLLASARSPAVICATTI